MDNSKINEEFIDGLTIKLLDGQDVGLSARYLLEMKMACVLNKMLGNGTIDERQYRILLHTLPDLAIDKVRDTEAVGAPEAERLTQLRLTSLLDQCDSGPSKDGPFFDHIFDSW